MAEVTVGQHRVESVEGNSLTRFLTTYVFATDHKIIGLQFLFSSLIWFFVGGLLALAVRWQLAWPWSDMPIFGSALFADSGGQISPEFYTMLFTMHATIMIFFVVIPVLAGAFGNYLIPLMIGADDMAFPKLNMLSYWFMWPAFGCIILSFFMPGYGASSGWTSYPPLSVFAGDPQTMWILAMLFVGVSSMMGSINYLTTIIQMRAPGMSMFRLPMTIWGMFITAIMQAFALPVLTAALLMQLSDRLIGTGFFLPENIAVDNAVATSGGGQVLLWQHLFWFYSHPAVYIMILPAMGMVSDMIACNSRKPLFGYRPMVYSITAIAGMGFIVWGHHMFVSGMNHVLAMSFMVSTMLIALPSGIKVFNWIGTLWGGRLHLNTAMLFSIGFVSMFVIGGLSGIVMSAPPVDIVIHDTYYIVAHLHYVLFGSSILGVFGAIYFWYPKMFGKMMNETMGKFHFVLTFIFLNGTFFPMHFLSRMPRRVADPYVYEGVRDLLPLNQFMTVCAMSMGAVQIIFIANFFGSMIFGKKASRNPWNSNTLEWAAPSPPGHGNFDFQPKVFRGPYEYSHPDRESDFFPQTEPRENRPGHPGIKKRIEETEKVTLEAQNPSP
ncbi:MAG: cbb3-type cytochrome c oxidase subunit I [Planctomycetota bacterium]